MNDFHNLNICIEKKDKHAAMMVFRNKSEFAARKILEKIKVRDIPGTGKIFWYNVQRWLLTACRQQLDPVAPVSSSSSPVPAGNNIVSGEKTAKGGDYPGWPSHKQVSDLSPSADVCAWPEGLPPVHAYMADGRVTRSQASPCVSEPPAEKPRPSATRVSRHLSVSPVGSGAETGIQHSRYQAAAGPTGSWRQPEGVQQPSDTACPGERTAADQPQIHGILPCSAPGSLTFLPAAGRGYDGRPGVLPRKDASTGLKNPRLNTGSCLPRHAIDRPRRFLSLAVPVCGQFYGKANTARQRQHNGFTRRQLNALCGHRERFHDIPDQRPVHVALCIVIVNFTAYLDRAYLLTRQDVDVHCGDDGLSIQSVPPGMPGLRPQRILHDISGIRFRGEAVCRHRYWYFTGDRGLHGCRQIKRRGRFLASCAARQGQAKKCNGAHTVYHFYCPSLWGIPSGEPEVSARCG